MKHRGSKNRFLNLGTAQYKNGDKYIASSVSALLWPFTIFGIFIAATFLIFDETSLVQQIQIGAGVLALLMTHMIAHDGKYTAALLFFLVVCWLLLASDVLLVSGMFGLASFGLFLIIFIASLLMHPAASFSLIFLTVVVYAVHLWIHSHHLIGFPHPLLISINEMIVIFLYFIFAEVLGVLARQEFLKTSSEAEESFQLFHAVVQENKIGMLITDLNFIVMESNKEACRLLGENCKDIVDKTIFEIIPPRFVEVLYEIAEGVFNQEEYVNVPIENLIDGEKVMINMNVRALALENGKLPQYILVSMQDVTEQKVSEQKVQRLAFMDFLTKADNRLSFNYRLRGLVSRVQRDGGWFALVYFDLNGFKAVNDRYGHTVGDVVLVEFVQRLKSVTRASDYIARIGGDEFVLIIEDVNSLAYLDKTLARVQEIVEKSFQVGEQIINLTTSVGIAHYPRDGETADDLLRFADQAMYADKAMRKAEENKE